MNLYIKKQIKFRGLRYPIRSLLEGQTRPPRSILKVVSSSEDGGKTAARAQHGVDGDRGEGGGAVPAGGGRVRRPGRGQVQARQEGLSAAVL